MSTVTRLLTGAEQTWSLKEVSPMKLWKYDVASSSQTWSSVITNERSRQPVHRKPGSLSIRMRGIDCMLAELDVQIEMLRWDRTCQRRVRNGLANTSVRLKRTAPRHTLLKASRFRLEGNQKGHHRRTYRGATCEQNDPGGLHHHSWGSLTSSPAARSGK